MSGKRIAGAAGLLARGIAIGAANTVPGVSGGTIAVVTGIYDRLVGAIGDVLSRRWRQHLGVLVPVLGGVLLGIAGFAWVIEWGLANAAEQTFFVFLGLIAGSLPLIVHEVRRQPLRWYHPLLAAAAFGLLVLQAVVGEPPLSSAITELSMTTLLPLLGAGMVATATMIIPGVSGSFVLLIIGMYATFIQAVRSGNIPVLLVLVAGAAVGLVAAARLMSALLGRARGATYWVILGLVAGSMVGIWPGVSSWQAGLANLAAAAVGAGLALVLGKRPRTMEADDATQ